MRTIGNTKYLSAAIVAATLWAGPAFAASSVTGTVTYEGKVPNLAPIAMNADPVCAKKHSSAVPNEMLVLGSGNTMGNILVWVSKGVPAGKTYPAPKEAFVLDQNGCQYKPHVAAIMAGQQVKILNSDGVLHNIHPLPKVNTGWNQAMPPTVKEITKSFGKAESAFPIKCDVHPWMNAYLAVFTNPFYSVTQSSGKYTISNLDPGTYEISAWHERLGVKTASVTVGAGESKTQDFKFSAPK